MEQLISSVSVGIGKGLFELPRKPRIDHYIAEFERLAEAESIGACEREPDEGLEKSKSISEVIPVEHSGALTHDTRGFDGRETDNHWRHRIPPLVEYSTKMIQDG